MKIWLDDMRIPIPGYEICHSVNEAKSLIEKAESEGIPVTLIDCDYDLGEYELDGGCGMRLLEWLSNRKTYYPVEVHSAHITGAKSMENFIGRNWPH